MTVRVRHGKFRIALWFPNGCLTLAINQLLKHAKANAFVNSVGKSEIKEMVKALKKAKKYHKKIELVSVVSADGTRVKITV
ncbi:MAG: hypothetical protein HFK06_05975 [Clostridia bacterium]|nr:hypothetical protein [Clostridia bacterium]